MQDIVSYIDQARHILPLEGIPLVADSQGVNWESFTQSDGFLSKIKHRYDRFFFYAVTLTLS